MSGEVQGVRIDLEAVNGSRERDAGVAHAAELLAFTEAVMADDEVALERERAALRRVVSPEAFVDACAVIGFFNVVDRIADATGIPLDDALRGVSADLRSQLGLQRFASSANTPGTT